jgi:hypothetical protein
LAIFYINQLDNSLGPVVFYLHGSAAEAEFREEFRKELRGGATDELKPASFFRVFVVGCMLAEKWGHDRSFATEYWWVCSVLLTEMIDQQPQGYNLKNSVIFLKPPRVLYIGGAGVQNLRIAT